MSQNEQGMVRDLASLKRQAKRLLNEFRRSSPTAVETVAAHFPGADPETFRLAQAQLVVARSHGFASWARLRRAIGDRPRPRRPRARPAELEGEYVYDVDPVDGALAWSFFQACRDGDEAAVRRLIEQDPNLVHAQWWYTQPIHFAVYANQPEVLRVLLEAGTEPGRTRFMDSGWKQLLHRAELLGFVEVRDILESALRTRYGYAPEFERLKRALVARDDSAVDAVLVDAPELACATDVNGNGSIHWAVMTRQPRFVPRLRALGADPDARRSDGQTPAHLLFNGDYGFRVGRELAGMDVAGREATLEALLAAGANEDLSVACATGRLNRVRDLLRADPAAARGLDSGRRSPLMYAARGGHREVVETLLDHGADPNRPEELAPRGHALWMACARGRADIVRLLLAKGADPRAAPDSSDSCLGIAKARGGAGAGEIVALLEAHGAEPPMWHMSNEELRAAIVGGRAICREHWFAEEVLARNDLDLATVLLDHDPTVVDRLNGGTLRLGSPDVAISESAVLALLLEAGFDPDRPGWLGKTALHHYAGRGELGNVLLLVEHGADLDALDDEEHGTPLAWAAAGGHEEVVACLLRQGADPALPPDLPPATPLERARRSGHTRVARLLETWTIDGRGTGISRSPAG